MVIKFFFSSKLWEVWSFIFSAWIKTFLQSQSDISYIFWWSFKMIFLQSTHFIIQVQLILSTKQAPQYCSNVQIQFVKFLKQVLHNPNFKLVLLTSLSLVWTSGCPAYQTSQLLAADRELQRLILCLTRYLCTRTLVTRYLENWPTLCRWWLMAMP